jgi:hypothetical protein
VLFVPIAIWHVFRVVRHRYGLVRLIVPVAYTLAAAVQIFIWRTTEQTHQATPSKGEFVGDVAKLYGTRVSTEFLFGVRATERLWDAMGYWIAVVSVLALAAALVWKWRRAGSASRWFMLACVLASGAIFALSLSQRADFLAAMQLVSDAPYNFAGMRYQLFPAALLLLALLVPVDLPGPRDPRTAAVHRPPSAVGHRRPPPAVGRRPGAPLDRRGFRAVVPTHHRTIDRTRLGDWGHRGRGGLRCDRRDRRTDPHLPGSRLVGRRALLGTRRLAR